jgi:hypothetical protein
MDPCQNARKLAEELMNCGKNSSSVPAFLQCKVAEMRYYGATNDCFHETMGKTFTEENVKSFLNALRK